MPDVAASAVGLRVYPRGFLGGNIGVPMKPTKRPFEELVLRHQYHPGMFSLPKLPVLANHNIENITSKFLKQSMAILDVEFRELVLKVALGAFGTQDFRQWIYAQHDAGTTGELHIDFLQDTLNFIQYGKRDLSLSNWLPMLTLADVGSNVTPVEERVKLFFSDPETERERNASLVDVIQRWCSQDGGFEDMIQTLHVLFGEIAT